MESALKYNNLILFYYINTQIICVYDQRMSLLCAVTKLSLIALPD